jgi:chromosome segregation ATPase
LEVVKEKALMAGRNLWLATAITLLLLLAVATFRYARVGAPVMVETTSSNISPLSTAVVAATPDAVEKELAQRYTAREAVYQQQIEQLSQQLAERQSAYQAQIQELKNRIATAQSQQDQLEAQKYTYQQQVDELTRIRDEHRAAYQQQLQAATDQYNSRYTGLTARLSEVQSKLAEANALLNH